MPFTIRGGIADHPPQGYDVLVADKMRVQGFHYPSRRWRMSEKYGSGYREIPVVWNPTI